MYQLILILVITSGSFHLIAQDNSSIHSKLDALFQYCYDNKLYNGTVLIVKKDQILIQKSYGKSGPESKEFISGDTPFLLASISKQFTAFGIILLHSKGLLSYDDPVKKHLKDFPYPQISIRHLLNHTSGIPEYTKLINTQAEILKKQYKEQGTVVSNKEIAALIIALKIPLRFQPGTNFYYNNTGYVYLAMLIETLSGKSYAQYLEESIFKPLNMENSWVTGKEECSRKRRAIAYKYNYSNDSNPENEVPPFFKVYGDGGIYSSANDLHKWYLSLDKELLIDAIALKEAYQSPIIKGKKAPYGFGWFVRELPFNKHAALTHSGQFVGFTNSIFRDLDDQTTSIILSNNSHEINSEINRAVVNILYNRPYKKPKLNTKMVLGKLLSLEGIRQTKEFYESNKENERYDFSEKLLNQLGYDFLASDHKNKAIDVFKWNVELNPASANVYDSLGEAYLLLDNRKEALLNYQKAFGLDRSNVNAEKMIQKLKPE